MKLRNRRKGINILRDVAKSEIITTILSELLEENKNKN
jgi:hypothetical protein